MMIFFLKKCRDGARWDMKQARRVQRKKNVETGRAPSLQHINKDLKSLIS